MIASFHFQGIHLKSGLAEPPGHDEFLRPVWIDLINPDPMEIQRMDTDFALDLPTQEEMQEIEVSSRLYEEDGAYYMTMIYVANALDSVPETIQITFVLKDDLLLSMRHREIRILSHFINKASTKGLGGSKSAPALLIYILEHIVDWCADVLEKNHAEIEGMNRKIFNEEMHKKDHHDSLKQIAATGDLNSKIRESLASLDRLTIFLGNALETMKAPKDVEGRLRTLSADIRSLLDHAAFVSSKIVFLLDATLGLVNIEQNAIIKIFSVAAVIFLPPTLVASIYGMNFLHMPELQWVAGYPFALGLMLISAALPYLYFKHKGWL
ncbi:MAG: magnesium/cobalt transporter CorA [Alphaproteobacteria bacterium]|nr:magnesium/cobalt transporter CorA [Alphaproteobacteria bacterium]